MKGAATMAKLVFHVDVNSAYLSWEAARRVANGEPDIRLIPSVIGGDREKRTGVVLAKSIRLRNLASRQVNQLVWLCGSVLTSLWQNRTSDSMRKTPRNLWTSAVSMHR